MVSVARTRRRRHPNLPFVCGSNPSRLPTGRAIPSPCWLAPDALGWEDQTRRCSMGTLESELAEKLRSQALQDPLPQAASFRGIKHGRNTAAIIDYGDCADLFININLYGDASVRPTME